MAGGQSMNSLLTDCLREQARSHSFLPSTDPATPSIPQFLPGTDPATPQSHVGAGLPAMEAGQSMNSLLTDCLREQARSHSFLPSNDPATPSIPQFLPGNDPATPSIPQFLPGTDPATPQSYVGAGLPAMAVGQSMNSLLTDCLREQARSHSFLPSTDPATPSIPQFYRALIRPRLNPMWELACLRWRWVSR